MPVETIRKIYPAEENENSVMDKMWSQVFPLFSQKAWESL